MKRSIKLYPLTLLSAILIAVSVPLLPATPAYADSTHTWTTEADFEAGVLSNVDTSSSPGNVLLATDVDTGNGASDFMVVTDTTYMDDRTSAITQQSNAGSNVVHVADTTPFGSPQEILIIQMIGTGAGKWETTNIQSVSPGQITLTENLQNSYYADESSRAQVIVIYNLKDVTVKNGGVITCHAWNGSTGGIVFFRSTGTVTVDPGGRIDVSGKGFGGGGGGSGGGGAGGSGGEAGGSHFGHPDGYGGGSSGTGGGGGNPGQSTNGIWGFQGGDGGLLGNAGYAQSGQSGQGPGGGANDSGGTNGSSASLSIMQMGGGGGGGSSGVGGTGAGGGGGGGSNTCMSFSEPAAGKNGGWGGSAGQGGQGGPGGGSIIICANSIVASQQSVVTANGSNGVVGANGGSGGIGGNGGYGAQFCVLDSHNDLLGGAGGGGGGGGGGDGGGGGNGGGGGSGGTVWLTANNITLGGSGVTALGGSGEPGGQGGSGGAGGRGGGGGQGDESWANGGNGAGGPNGTGGSAGTSAGGGGVGKIRLDYVTLSGSTNPSPGYTAGVYDPSGTIASDVLDTGIASTPWNELDWQETVPAGTDNITFAVRASNSLFAKDNNTITWTAVGSHSPVTTGLPSGRYIQWRAILSTVNKLNSPVLHQVTVQYTNAPVVETHAATSIGESSATLNGDLVDLDPAPNAMVSFEWGISSGGYSWETTPQQMDAPGAFQANISGLLNYTIYYYRAKAAGAGWGTGYGQEMSFTTSGPPVISTNAADGVTTSSASLNGAVNYVPDGNMAAYFYWGTDPSNLNNQTEYQYNTGDFSQTIYGLSAGTTYYFQAEGLDDYDSYSGDTLSFTTVGVAPSVSTSNATSVTTNSATLNGFLSDPGSASTVNVSFQYGTTQGGPYPNSTPPQAMTWPGPFTANLTRLSADTTYYFRATGDGGTQGVGYGSEGSFTTPGLQPLVSTGDATLITANSATLNGALANLGSASTVNVYFQYGTTQGGPYPNSTPPQAMTSPGPFTANLTNLSAISTYYFRAAGDGGTQGVGYGNEMSFTTSAVPPSVSTAGATGITTTSATLNGQVTDMGTASTINASFEWGTEPDNLKLGTALQTLTAPGGFNAGLSSLSPNTTYYFRARGDGGASGTGYGATLSFTTPKVPPSVSTNGATDVTAGSATLSGTLHSLGTAPTVNVSFQYGTASGVYSVETTSQAMTSTGDFTAPTGGLAAATTYYFRAKGNGGVHGTSYGAEEVFTTSSIPPSVTTDNATDLTTNSAALNGNLDSLGSATVVNVSFQYGTTQGGPYTNSTTSQAKTTAGAFHIGVTGLHPATTYYYRAKADGGTNGTAYGAEASFRTGMFTPYVETVPATDQTDTTATLNGDLYSLGSATTVNVYFQYGTTHGGPYPNSTPPQAMAATGPFQAALNSLTPGTTYYFRATGDGGAYGVSNGTEMSFTTSRHPPIVATHDASDITSDNATLNGNLDSRGDAPTVNVSFIWGATPGGPYPNSTDLQAMTAPGAFQAGLTGLRGNTTYYFRARGDGGINGGAYGVERSFTTAKVPPTVYTDRSSNVTPTSATLHGFLDSMGTAPTVNVWFEWGTTQGGPYPNTTLQQAMGARGYFRADIIGLTPLTTYYFRAMADGGVHGGAVGDELSFGTGATPPSVSTGGVTGVTADAATLNGTLHSLGTATAVNVAFQYGTTSGGYTRQTASQILSGTGNFLANLSSLQPHTTYYYRAIADGGENGASYGAEHAFTTGALPPTTTTDAATDKTTDTAFLNGNLDNLSSSTTVMVSFQYSTTAGGPYPDSTSPQAKTSTGAFQAGISGLTPFTTYYYKAKANGGLNGAGYGAEMSFTTNHLPPLVWTGGASDIITNAATLNGNLYLMGSAPTADVSFEYGTTQGGPYPNSTPPQTMNEPDAFLADVNGLTPHTTYYFVAKADGGVHGTSYGNEQVFTTGSFPPSVSTGDTTNITASSATLNGDLRFLGSASTVNVSFLYGTTQGGPYPNVTTPQTMTATGVFNAGVSGLSANTAYYFKAKADGGIYGTSYGAEMSFITSGIPPSVTTQNASNITTTAARLNGSLNSLGSSTFANVSFQWGTTPGVYTDETTVKAMNATGAFFADLTGLTRNTIYYYRAKAAGDGTGYGVEQSFTTSGASDGVETATGVGIAYFSSDAGNIQNLVAVAERTLPATGKPSGLSFPEGFFSFTIVNVTPGSAVTITITLPQPLPVDTRFYKCQNGSWIDCTSLMGDNDGDNVITITITDGGLGDADGVANGTIVDPCGPGMLATSAPSTTARRVSPSPPSQLPPADVHLRNISVSPGKTQAGQPVTVLANVVNNGASSGSYNVVLSINGRVEQQRTIEVSPGTAYPVKFTVTESRPGTYTVNIDNQKGSFVILGAPGGLSQGAGEIILFAVAMAVIVLLSGLLIIVARRRL
jgi:hypothetical protein